MLNEIITNRKQYWLAFTLMVFIQLAIPAYMIYTSESVIEKGQVYQFELGAIDPHDPFRRKYIILRPKENFLKDYITEEREAYATFSSNVDGYTYIESLAEEVPETPYYLKVSIRHSDKTGTLITYPFNKYYMNEEKAKPPEDLIREMRQDTTQVTYAQVSILNGEAQVLKVMIGDNNLIDLLNETE